RHKGVSLHYDLAAEADKAAIDEQRKRLVAQLIPALKHYVAEIAKDIPVVFSGWPAKRPPVFFFDRNEGLARAGVPDVDQIELGMPAERAISMRLIPSGPHIKPLSPRELGEKVNAQLGAFWIRGFSGLCHLNHYGAIAYEPQTHGQLFNEIKALTQVFRT